MYDELVKRLRCVAEEVADDYDVDPYNAEQRCLTILQAADAIEQLSNAGSAYGRGWTLGYDAGREESKPRWIPVTERLPEEDGWYQVYAPSYSGGSSSGLKNIKGNMYSAFKNGKWSVEVGYHKRPGCVKAWMSLPEPPKEES